MILQEKFKRAEIYLTSKGETIQDVCRKTGADLVINGHWYGENGKPIGNFKADGKVLSQEWDAALGYGWSDNGTPLFSWYMESFDNFLCTIPLLYNGEKLSVSGQSESVRRPCQRPVISFKGRAITFVYEEKATLEQMQDKMLALGCTNALCLDGGGSGKYALKRSDGTYEVEEASNRHIYNYLCVWFDKPKQPVEPDEGDDDTTSYRNGIDVSQWQGTIEWEKVKASGIEFAMIRAGYGQNNIDPQFERNISECNRLGIPCGVYWFSYALNAGMARQEALYALEAVKPYVLEYPIAFDFEGGSVDYAARKGVKITKELASSFARAFCDELEKNRYYAMVYTNPSYLNTYFDAEIPKQFDIWLAQWPSKPDLAVKPSQAGGIWQYTSSGSVSGISGRVDLNAGYFNYPEIMRSMKLNGLGDEPEPIEPEEAELDRAVKWAIEQGISDGTRLDDPAKRSEVILMLYRENGGK